MSEKRPYHHGDLRRVVIETAEQMLEESNGWQFTLREVARRADVSHAAPYRHFPDKGSLLLELALRGFDQLTLDMGTAASQGHPSVRAEFLALAGAYIAFGEKNPSRYRLMFSSEAGAPHMAHLSERAMSSLLLLKDLLTRGTATGEFRPQPLPEQVAACWAQVHGITMLSIEGLLFPEKVGSSPIKTALDTLLNGLATSPRSASDTP